ncbi:hypothetical protein PVK06_043577 [Gossypium arboreum]|uniref:Uncharacterized protein n=1 Tax=Gossypium arboreum TaxID=29729 RepID=A0ABR0MNV9_GOSAR|nr:hypothetical protein PVK06_043577 [Gossypium arboreum]
MGVVDSYALDSFLVQLLAEVVAVRDQLLVVSVGKITHTDRTKILEGCGVGIVACSVRAGDCVGTVDGPTSPLIVLGFKGPRRSLSTQIFQRLSSSNSKYDLPWILNHDMCHGNPMLESELPQHYLSGVS